MRPFTDSGRSSRQAARRCTDDARDNVLAPIEIRVARTARRCVIRRRLRERLLVRRMNCRRSYCCVCDFLRNCSLEGSQAAAVEFVETISVARAAVRFVCRC